MHITFLIYKNLHRLCTFKQTFARTLCTLKQKFVRTLCTFKAYLKLICEKLYYMIFESVFALSEGWINLVGDIRDLGPENDPDTK